MFTAWLLGFTDQAATSIDNSDSSIMLTEQYVLATNSAEIIFGRSKDITTNSRVQLRPVFFRTGSLPRNAISESLLVFLWQIPMNVKVCKTTR